MPWAKLLIGLVVIGAVAAGLRGARGRGDPKPPMSQRFTEGWQRTWDGLPESSLPKRLLADMEAIRANTERMVELLEARGAERPQET